MKQKLKGVKAEAEDAVSIARACFYPLLEAIKKELA